MFLPQHLRHAKVTCARAFHGWVSLPQYSSISSRCLMPALPTAWHANRQIKNRVHFTLVATTTTTTATITAATTTTAQSFWSSRDA
jgi:hypothetical protein